MKKLICLLCLWIGFGAVYPTYCFSKSLPLINRIEGQVFDENRVPISEVNVELLNAVDSLLTRTKTNSAGSFSFRGVSSGRFQIRVLPLINDLIGETKDVEVTPLRAGGSDTVYVDFYLRFDKRRTPNFLLNNSSDVIFVQEVPQNSQKLYKSALNKLEREKKEGFAELEEAIKLFPNYFDALSRLGKEYVLLRDFKKAYPYLIRAIDINPRSFSSYYALSYAFYQLKEIPAAVMAAKACIDLNASSVNAQILYGTLLRLDSKYEGSEKALLKAKSLVKDPNAEIHWQLALLYNKLNRNKEAAQELETYLKIFPDSPDKQKIKDLAAKLKSSK